MHRSVVATVLVLAVVLAGVPGGIAAHSGVAGQSSAPGSDAVLDRNASLGPAGDPGSEDALDPDNEPPLADAGLDQTVPRTAEVRLDATGSRDPDGSIVEYRWSITTPDNRTITPACETCPRTHFRANETGTYAVTVTVTDDDGASRSDTLYVTVTPGQPPSVSIGGPASVTEGQETTYTAEIDRGAAPLERVVWRLDGTVLANRSLESDADTDRLTVTAPATGEYRLTATVLDEDHRATATRTVTVRSACAGGPTARITDVSPASPTPDETVTVGGAAGAPADCSVVERTWSIEGTDPDSASAEQATATWSDEGTYDVTYVVTDEDGNTDTASRTVTVDASGGGVDDGSGTDGPVFEVGIDGTNSPVEESDTLVVNATVRNAGGARGTQTVSLATGGEQRDARELSLSAGDSREITLSWDTGSGDAGSYTAEVSSDDSSDTQDVTVRGDGQPTLDFTVSPDTVSVGEDATLEVEVDDPEGRTYVVWFDYDNDGSWSFAGTVDSPYPSTYTETRSWDSAGTYTIPVKISSVDGPTLTDDDTITVESTGDGDGSGDGNGGGNGGGNTDGSSGPGYFTIDGPEAVSYYVGPVSDSIDPPQLDYTLENSARQLICSDVDSVDWTLETEDGQHSITKTTSCPWVTFEESEVINSLVGPTNGEQDLSLSVTATKNNKTSSDAQVVHVCKNADVSGGSCDLDSDYPPPGFSIDGPETIYSGNTGPYEATVERDAVWDQDPPDWSLYDAYADFALTSTTGNPTSIKLQSPQGKKTFEIRAETTATADGGSTQQTETKDVSDQYKVTYDPSQGCNAETEVSGLRANPSEPSKDEQVDVNVDVSGCDLESTWTFENTNPDYTELDFAQATWQTTGDYTVTITLTDSANDAKDKDSITVSVQEDDSCAEAIDASIDSYSPSSPSAGQEVNFQATPSGCDITTSWTFEGTTPKSTTDTSATAEWATGDQYRVEYTVRSGPVSASDDRLVNVEGDCEYCGPGGL